jgi:hypothetical protein
MEELWTNAQSRAWDYIQYAIANGLNSSTGLMEYRAGGGQIRTEDWGIAYNRLHESSAEWSTINYLSPTDTLPYKLFASSPINYSTKYVAFFTANITELYSGKRDTIERLIGFDERPTKQEFFAAAEEQLRRSDTDPAATVNYITRLEFFRRKGR